MAAPARVSVIQPNAFCHLHRDPTRHIRQSKSVNLGDDPRTHDVPAVSPERALRSSDVVPRRGPPRSQGPRLWELRGGGPAPTDESRCADEFTRRFSSVLPTRHQLGVVP